MALTELQIRQVKPKEKRFSLSDGRGLLLEIHPNGAKYWICRVKVNGKEKRKHIGSYPALGLKEARIKAAEERVRLFNPELKKEKFIFGEIAAEWLEKRMNDKKASYLRTVNLRLNRYILPELKNMPVNEITSGTVLNLCRKIEARGTLETAARVKVLIGQIFRYAIATDRAENDPTAGLKGALKTRNSKHMATLTKPSDIALLMKNINAYPHAVVRCALKFSALTFCRPGEIRHAEWNEIDFENREWRIPAEKMKMKRVHIVPLATQAIEVLIFLRDLTGKGRWLFPSARMDGRPMSENTVRVALRSMGYSNEQMTAHGFRGMASTRLNEMGWPPDVIERQLAHAERNSVRAAYNHAEYLPERQKMMQFWADYLDEITNQRY